MKHSRNFSAPVSSSCSQPLQDNAKLLLRLLLLLTLSVSLSGCGIFSSKVKNPQSAGSGQRGTKPYTINGKTYYPLQSAGNYYEEGIASWYGPNFHGKQTANGERYNMYSMTAAHKILPFNTQVRVTNLDNGKQTLVRVNDRGPFVNNRVIDLSKAAASQIDMLGTGTARVRLESVGGVVGMRDNGDISGNFYVQVGAFQVRNNADNLAQRLRSRGLNSRSGYVDLISLWRVQVGPYPSLFQARQARDRLREEFPGGFVVSD